MAVTKGTGFINVRNFVTERYGVAAWRQLVGDLSKSDQMVVNSVVSIGWYDLAIFGRLIRAMDSRFGTSSGRLVYMQGRFAAERDLTTVHQWFLKLFRPSIAIEQMDKYWKRFHDTGEWTIERRSEQEIISRLSRWGIADPIVCRQLHGYLERTLELLGGRDIKLAHTQCRARGEPVCEFHLLWKTPKESVDAGGSGDLPPWMPPPTGMKKE